MLTVITGDTIVIISPHNPGPGRDTERKPGLSDVFGGTGSSCTLCGQHTGYLSTERATREQPTHGNFVPLSLPAPPGPLSALSFRSELLPGSLEPFNS